MMMFQGSVIVEHKIELIDPRPINQPVRPLPFNLQTEINQMINDMQKQEVIEESSSSWCSLVVLKQKRMALGDFA